MPRVKRAELAVLADVLDAYVQAGLRFLNGTPLEPGGQTLSATELSGVRSAVLHKVISSNHAISAYFTRFRAGSQAEYALLPVPLHKNSEIAAAFIVPSISPLAEDVFYVEFSLVLVIATKGTWKTSAYRLERPDAANYTHGYPHAQVSRIVKELDLITSLEKECAWMPTSYPAWPIPAKNGLELLSSLLLSLHGFNAADTSNYSCKVVRAALAQANKLKRFQLVEACIKRCFQKISPATA